MPEKVSLSICWASWNINQKSGTTNDNIHRDASQRRILAIFLEGFSGKQF